MLFRVLRVSVPCVERLTDHLHSALVGFVSSNEPASVHKDTAGNPALLAELSVPQTPPCLEQ
jgi:hypothetical protein